PPRFDRPELCGVESAQSIQTAEKKIGAGVSSAVRNPSQSKLRRKLHFLHFKTAVFAKTKSANRKFPKCHQGDLASWARSRGEWGRVDGAPRGRKASDQWEAMDPEVCGRPRFMKNMRGIMARQTSPRSQKTSTKASMADWRCNSPYSIPWACCAPKAQLEPRRCNMAVMPCNAAR